MTDAQSGAHLFVSYASGDGDRVREIAEKLKGAGLRLWIDRQGIPGGVSYGPEIAGAIKGCRAMLLMSSAAAFASRNVRQEIQLAWKHERPILPLRLDLVDTPDDLEYWLEGCQWIEVLDRPVGAWLPDVMRSLNLHGVIVTSILNMVQPKPDLVKLPTPLTGLVGRDREVAGASELLGSHRIVTLTGPGGVGKTRLAIAVAERVAPSFPDGVWFVRLAALRDPALVVPTIAETLGIRDEGTQSQTERLLAFL